MTRKHVPPNNAPSRRKKPSRLIWMWAMLGAVLLIAVVMVVFKVIPASTAAPAATPTPVAQTITPAQAYAKLEAGAFFLDVRTQEEWNDFHIKGSTLIPLTELQDRLSELPWDRDIVVVCSTGHRSLSAASLLQQAGFTRLSSLDGGLTAWMEANYPVEK